MGINILMLAGYSYPEHAASSYLGQNRNEAFAKAGFIIQLYTPTPCRGITPEVRKKYCQKEFRHESLLNGHMTIHRFSMYPEGKNPVMRALRYFLCSCAHVWKGIFDKHAKSCNVIYVPSTPPIQGAVAAIVKKARHIPFVYNLQDIFPDSLVNNGLAKRDGLLWKIGRKIEDFTYRNADKIIVISEDFKKNIMAKGTQYSKQIKEDAVRYRKDHPELTVQKAAENLGISESALKNWMKAARENEGSVPTRGTGNYSSDEAKEIARLKRELRDTKDALEILKKAIGILGK